MDLIQQIIDFFLHLDAHLSAAIAAFGPWIYVILFAIVFCETGLVITPFLPGDSLLFAAGALAANGDLNVYVLYVLFVSASILGDTANYAIGSWLGTEVLERKFTLIKREHIVRTQVFYKKYGGKAIMLSRFVPIVRTFAPFVAGVGTMHYGRFFFYNVLGGFLWVSLFLCGGYFFGNIPFVQKNFEFVIVGIVAASVVPMVWEWLKRRDEISRE
jgi:membrane-associated protein